METTLGLAYIDFDCSVTHGGGSVPITVAFGAFMGSGRADYSGKST